MEVVLSNEAHRVRLLTEEILLAESSSTVRCTMLSSTPGRSVDSLFLRRLRKSRWRRSAKMPGHRHVKKTNKIYDNFF